MLLIANSTSGASLYRRLTENPASPRRNQSALELLAILNAAERPDPHQPLKERRLAPAQGQPKSPMGVERGSSM
jgi:hypothetical protein